MEVFWPATTGLNILQEALGIEVPWSDVPEAPDVLGARFSVRLEATNGVAFYRLVNRSGTGDSTPPDPATLATPPQPNVYNELASLTAFLYTGSNAVQVGVSSGTIKPTRASVLRGRVLQRDTNPLSRVRVAIAGHPEYGYTYTRTNGLFDLVVNAASYTVDYQAIGYCPAQRQVTLPALGYGVAPDVILVPQDVVATQVLFGPNAPPQVAQSSPQTDQAGTRAATVFIPAGTSATMVMPDGSLRPVGSLTIRVTEFTVGNNGPAMMPVGLPPNSAYTYCADFSGDEALDAGARSVQFSQPVPIYVDNFLEAPVGTLVPIGFYSREQRVWVPSPNGIVMQVLGSTDGAALIDLHGRGEAETADTLAANGFTAEELRSLALLYPAGKTLWRAPVPHLSIWDFNFGGSPPDPNKPNRPGDKPKGDSDDNSPNNYGTLNFSAQTFSERIPLVGVPFALNYSSARVPDYRVDDQITIPVTWQPPPADPCDGGAGCAVGGILGTHWFDPPAAIVVETDVAGEHSLQTYPGTNQWATISWDGRDAYGRLVGGTHLATIDISYVFPNRDYLGICCGPDLMNQFPALFGNAGNMIAFEAHGQPGVGVGALFQRLLTYPDHRKLGLGGWSPNPLHRLDPAGGILYYGDGRIRKVPQKSLRDNFPTGLQSIGRVAAATPDGSVYFYGEFGFEWYIFRRNPGGGYEAVTASRLAPGAVRVYLNGWGAVDGLPTDRVVMDVNPESMSTGPDGSLYVTDGRVIARMTPDGIWHVILGLHASSPPTLQPDGALASESFASWGGGTRLAVGPDSSVYYTAFWPYYANNANGTNYTMVRKIAPDGRLYTVFGGGGIANSGVLPTWKTLFGTAAHDARYVNGSGVGGLAVGTDGTLYVAEQDGASSGIFKISQGGVILPFLNGAPVCGEGLFNPIPGDTNITAQIRGDQGKLATDVTTYAGGPTSLVVARDGSVYFAQGNLMVWRVNPNGVVERVAGRYTQSVLPPADLPLEYGDPLNTTVYPVVAMALTSDDTLLLVNSQYNGNPGKTPICIIPGRSSLQGTLAAISSEIIPSEDGAEVYAFDPVGKHLETLDGLTGSVKWSFGYDASSLVVSITDVAGQITRIERDPSGRATAIVGPYGQRTSLAMDANGFLSAVTNPAQEITSLLNSAGGLLLGITGPSGETYTVAYDDLGRVTNVADPLGGGWTDARSDKGVLPNYSYEVDVNCTNSIGDTLSRQMLLDPNGDTRVYSSRGGHPTGTTISRLTGDRSSTFSDGSALSTAMGADPRFGSQARQPVLSTLSLPNGLVWKASVQRTVGLTNATDPLSLTGLTNVTTVNGNSYTQVYNPTNRTLTLTSPAGRAASLAGDALGRIIRATAPGQPVIDIAFDDSGRVMALTNSSAAGIARAAFGYDALGQLVTLIDPLDRTNAFGYDAAGRLNRQVLADGAVATFTQDSEGNLTSVIPPNGQAHIFQFSPVGLVSKYTPPQVGADASVTYQYDSERNLTGVSLPDGQTVALTKGLGGRLEQMTLGSGPTLTYQYGTNAGSGHLMLVAITSTFGDSLQFEYLGSITTNVTWSGSITGHVSVQLNSGLLPISQSVNGSPIAFTYDRDRLLTQAGSLGLTRDPVSGLILGTGLSGATDQRQFDDRGLLTNYVAFVNGASIWSIALTHDLVGRITNKVETVGGITTAFGYAYDARGRLREVWQDGVLSASYTYDPNGNRLSRNTLTASYDAQDRVQSFAGTSFGWSLNGDLHSQTSEGQTTTYLYDARGGLIAVTPPADPQITYTLDAAGRRIGKKVGGTLQRGWLWADDLPIAELDSTSAVALRFVYAADDKTPSFLIKGSATYRIFSDERGSVRLVVNVADGSIAQRLDYDEFGRVLADSNPGFQPFAFAGGLYDPDTGLVRFGARDYLAQTGQWTARDPIGFDAGQLSLYAYAGNDPLNSVDPHGLGPNSPPPNDNGPDGNNGNNGDNPGDNSPYLVGRIAYIKSVNDEDGPTGIRIRHQGSNQFEPAGLNTPVYLSDVVKTDKNTAIALEFIIGGRVGVAADSGVQIASERSVVDAEFRLSRVFLRKGGVWAETAKLKEILEVQTNGGVMGIKG